MSTSLGQSFLHPLQPIQRSNTSVANSSLVGSSGSSPDIAPRSAFARPRVDCTSSSAARNVGHITPPVVSWPPRQPPQP